MATQPMTGWQKLAAGRSIVHKNMPYLDSALLLLAPVEVPGLGTIGVTENGVLSVDLEWLKTLTNEEVAAVLVHEISHVLRNTFARTRQLVGFDVRTMAHDQLTLDQLLQLRRSNIAADLAINPDVRDAGFSLPKFKHVDRSGKVEEIPAQWPKDYGWAEQLLHEEYFRMLVDDEESTKRLIAQIQAAMDHALSDPDHKDGGNPAGCGSGWCGTGGGMPHGNEPPGDDPTGRTPAEMDNMRRSVADAINSAAAGGRGTIPEGWVRWAGEVSKPPKVPWPQKLQRLVRLGAQRQAGCVNLRYDKISRRQAAVGYGVGAPILPGFFAPKPNVMFAIDTSGSMGDHQLELAVTETAGVTKSVGGEMTLVTIDAEVHTHERVRSWKDVIPKLVGGGGTVFTPFFDMLKELKGKDRPSVIVFATDGDAWGVPDEPPPNVKFIWLLTGEHCRLPENVTWGEVINIDDDVMEEQP